MIQLVWILSKSRNTLSLQTILHSCIEFSAGNLIMLDVKCEVEAPNLTAVGLTCDSVSIVGTLIMEKKFRFSQPARFKFFVPTLSLTEGMSDGTTKVVVRFTGPAGMGQVIPVLAASLQRSKIWERT